MLDRRDYYPLSLLAMPDVKSVVRIRSSRGWRTVNSSCFERLGTKKKKKRKP
ncbi:hypothetical protein PGB90_005011 [Kerria lacca]